MSWFDKDFEIELALEKKQSEEELLEFINQEKTPNWDFCDEN